MILKRANKFTSFIVMDVMAKAEELERKGENVIPINNEPQLWTTTKCASLLFCKNK